MTERKDNGINRRLPDDVLTALATEPMFSVVVEQCLLEEELVSNFERLHDVSRPSTRRTPIEQMVDKSTGFSDDQWAQFLSAFIPFVYRCVWLTWEGRFSEG